MTRAQTISRLCELVHYVWRRVDPGAKTASDCICEDGNRADFRNEGKAIEAIEALVFEKYPYPETSRLKEGEPDAEG